MLPTLVVVVVVVVVWLYRWSPVVILNFLVLGFPQWERAEEKRDDKEEWSRVYVRDDDWSIASWKM